MKTGENIYHRKDGRWEGRYIRGYREDGRAQYASVYGRTYQEVKEKRNRRLTEHMNTPSPVCRMTVKELCLQWLKWKQNTIKESSYFHYERLIKTHIEPVLGSLRASALTVNTLSRFVDDKLAHGRLDKTGGLSAKTVQNIVVVVKAVMKLAGLEYGLQNRTEAIKLPRIEQAEVQVLNNADIQRLEAHLWANADNSNAGMLLCSCTGLRLGEVCALQWSDIDWDRGVLHVRKTVQRLPQQDSENCSKTHLTLTKPKTKTAEREIPIPPNLASYLHTAAQGQAPDAFIATGKPSRIMEPRTYQYRFQSLLKKLGIGHIPFHGLRHTFATRCIQAGMDVKGLSEILGHTTVSMTLNRYVHPSLETKRQQMALICQTA